MAIGVGGFMAALYIKIAPQMWGAIASYKLRRSGVIYMSYRVRDASPSFNFIIIKFVLSLVVAFFFLCWHKVGK